MKLENQQLLVDYREIYHHDAQNVSNHLQSLNEYEGHGTLFLLTAFLLT